MPERKKFSLFPLLVLVWPYLPFTLLIWKENVPENFSSAYSVLSIVLFIANILYARSQKDCRMLAKWNMILKLAQIPWFVLVFLVGIGSLGLAIHPVLAAVGIMTILILFVMDYIQVFTTSRYGIHAILLAQRRGMPRFVGWVLRIMHHLFVFDVAAAVILYIMVKKLPEMEKNDEVSCSALVEELAES